MTFLASTPAPLITPATLYWLTRLDPILCCLAGFGYVSFFVACTYGVCAIGAGDTVRSYSATEDAKNQAKLRVRVYVSRVITWLIVATTLLASRTFVPTTKEAALIYVAPAVLNSELVSDTIPKEARELYSIAKLWLGEKAGVKEPLKEGTRNEGTK